MITAEALRIYHRYNGDVDGFSRQNDPQEMRAITDDDWHHLDVLWQRVALESSVPVADSFRAETTRLLAQHVADKATVQQLRQLAKRILP